MLKCQTVGDLLAHFQLTLSLKERISGELGFLQSRKLFAQLCSLPVKRSHAATRLGSYVCRGRVAVAIRLQFVQETKVLQQTLLHEIAHFLDHQTRQDPRSYPKPHGQSWQRWLYLIDGHSSLHESNAIKSLYRQRLKPVARCKGCGEILKRLRHLPKGRRWIHRNCGGQLEPLS